MAIDMYWIRSPRGEPAIKNFIAALKNKNNVVSENAMSALANAGQYAFDYLMIELLDKDAQYRTKIRWILSKADPNWTHHEATNRAIPGFIEALNSKDKDIRLGAIEALGEIKDSVRLNL